MSQEKHTSSSAEATASNGDVSARKRVSVVWNYFEKLNKYRVRCKLCLHEQNYQSTTGNILRHLKSKHRIDATLKGQSENPDVRHLPVLNDSSNAIKYEDATIDSPHRPGASVEDEDLPYEKRNVDNEVKTTRSLHPNPRPHRESKSKLTSYAEEGDTEEDPYGDNSGQYEEYLISAVPTGVGDTSNYKTNQASYQNKRQRQYTVEEERVVAETEYFKEKAAFYKMQKNLIALQAKKVKWELDQMLR